jgi:hypothetical protein
MRTRFSLLMLVIFLVATATGCHGRFLRRGCNSTTRADLPPVPVDYCPNP